MANPETTAPEDDSSHQDELTRTTRAGVSPGWRWGVVFTLVVGFAVLLWMTARVYVDAPPIPQRVVGPTGEAVFTSQDILAGQEVFLKYGLMENGTIWGHGAYLGPDFSAQYLHTLAIDTGQVLAQQRWGRDFESLSPPERELTLAEIRTLLKENRYNPYTQTLVFTVPEMASYNHQIGQWAAYFQHAGANRGLPSKYIQNLMELRQLTAFFAWTAWASIANRPGELYSYTNNFPYDPDIGNTPTSATILWSALSLVFLLGGIALVLYAFGRYNFLGWKRQEAHIHPYLLPGNNATDSQQATIKYFVIVALLFLAQTLVGGATAHFRAEPGSFYGFDLANYLPSNLLRTWHLQLAIFWITTASWPAPCFWCQLLAVRNRQASAAASTCYSASCC